MQGTAPGEPVRTLRRVTWALASLMALSVAAASPVAATPRLGATSSPAVTHVTLRSRQVYTNTGISVRVGDSVTISASGVIRFGGGKIKAMTPPGIPRGPECDKIARSEPRTTPWPAPKESCWSLIATVGSGAPLEVGASTSFRAGNAGMLRLGLNDNFVDDNSGSWRATISVTRAPTTPTNPASSTKKSSSLIFVLIGVAALALVLLLAGWRQRTNRRRRRSQSAPVAADAELAAATVPLLAEAPREPPVAPTIESAPPETDSIDVNIFEVEFSNGLTLRVGYNHFPEGTELRWRVTQNRVPAAAGSFVTRGGGSTNHVETVPLGVKLEGRASHPDGADVQFDWSINGVPFRYSVRRDTNC